MSICLQGSAPNPRWLLWFENLSQKEAMYIEKIMYDAENFHTLDPLSMDILEELVKFISTTGKLSNTIDTNDSLEREGFGWVKTFHVLVTLCNLAQRHENFDEKKAKIILTDCLQKLCPKGFDMNAPLLWQGTKPLHWAASHGCAVLCSVLVDLGANLEEPKSENDGKTSLHIAASAGKINVIRELIRLGAKVKASAEDTNIEHTYEPIHAGAYEPEVIQFLWENGADINAISRDKTYGPTAIYIAVRGGRPEATQKLLDLGANVNEADYENLRNEIIKSIYWKASRFTCPDSKIGSWARVATTIAEYINTLIVLSNHQFHLYIPQLKRIKLNELDDDNSKDQIKYEDWVMLIENIKEINKLSKDSVQNEDHNYWPNKTKLLHVSANSLIQGIQKYINN